MLGRWLNIWYGIINFFYNLLSQITHFIQSKKYRQQILRLLQGQIYNPADAPVLGAMRKFIETMGKTDLHT